MLIAKDGVMEWVKINVIAEEGLMTNGGKSLIYKNTK